MTITQEQREARRHGIGSSDVPALFGLSPYKQAYHVWKSKVGQDADDDSDPLRFEMGDAAEPVGLRWLGRKLGRQFPTPDTWRLGVLVCHADGYDATDHEIAEVKARSDHANWGTEGLDSVPDDVLLQCQALMLVGSAHFDRPIQTCHVVRIDSQYGWRASHYIVPAHGDIQRAIQDRAEQFWRDHVLTGQPPPIEPEHRTSESLLSTIERQSGLQVAVPVGLVEQYYLARRALADAEEEADRAKARLLAALVDEQGNHADGAIVPGWNVSYRPSSRSGLDVAAIKRDCPQIAEKYATRSVFRTLRVTPKEGARAE